MDTEPQESSCLFSTVPELQGHVPHPALRCNIQGLESNSHSCIFWVSAHSHSASLSFLFEVRAHIAQTGLKISLCLRVTLNPYLSFSYCLDYRNASLFLFSVVLGMEPLTLCTLSSAILSPTQVSHCSRTILRIERCTQVVFCLNLNCCNKSHYRKQLGEEWIYLSL